MTIKIGLVGLGEHALRAHVKHLANDSRVNIVASFDPNPVSHDNLKNYAVEAPYFSNEEDFWKTSMDAVFIMSPDKYHATQMKKAIDLNYHVFCEKPMCVSFHDVNILNEALTSAREKKLTIATCHPRRLDPPFMWIKKQIEEGVFEKELGKLLRFDFTFWYKKVEDTPEDEWKKSRSLLSDHFGHEIDLLAFLFPEQVNKLTATTHKDSYNHYEVSGITDKEVHFRFLGLRTLDETVYEEVLQLVGEKGSWIINLSQGNVIKLPYMETIDIPEINYDVRFSAVNLNFIDAILKTKENYLTIEDIKRNNTLSVELEKNKQAHWIKQ